MSDSAPSADIGAIALRYEGEGRFAPPNDYWAKKMDAAFVIGARYLFAEQHERSLASHRYFFAAVNEAWSSLPEEAADQYPSPEHLRKYALIKAGYRNTAHMAFRTRAQALRVASFLRQGDEYAVVTVEGPVVARHTAKSQSYRSMGKEEFRKSIDGVLGVLAEMIGVTKEQLEQSGRDGQR